MGEFVSIRAVLRRWLGTVPPWPYVLAALVGVGVGRFIEYLDVLKSLGGFAETALRQVSAFSPLSLAYGFLGHLEKCWDVTDISGAYVRTDCRKMSVVNPENVITALYHTVRDVIDNPNIAAMLILLGSLVAGFLICWRLVSSLSISFGWLGILVVVIATPFVGSCIAFVLQVMGIVFFTLAGAVVGFLIWIATQLTVFFAVLKAGRAVHENAALLKNIDDRLRPPPP